MPLSYNMAPGGLLYSPERDFAYQYPRMVSCVIRAFNTEFWPELLEVLSRAHPEGKDALWDQTCEAKDRFCEFLNICCEDPTENVAAVLERSGFTKLPPEAQIAWCAMLGQIIIGQLFQGIRDITPRATQHSTVLELLQAGRDAARTLNKVPNKQDQEILRTGFKLYAQALRESGVEQGEVRKLLSEVFSGE